MFFFNYNYQQLVQDMALKLKTNNNIYLFLSKRINYILSEPSLMQINMAFNRSFCALFLRYKNCSNV